MKASNLFVIAAIVLAVSGCTWIEHVKDSISSPEDAAWLKGAPDWVAKGCKSHPKARNWFACAVGMNQNNGNMNAARTKAVADGIDQLARTVFDRLHPMASSPRAKQKMAKDGVKVTKAVYATPLAGATTIDSWISRRGNRDRALSLTALDADGLRKTVKLIDDDEKARLERRRAARAKAVSAFTGDKMAIPAEPEVNPTPEAATESAPQEEAKPAEAPTAAEQAAPTKVEEEAPSTPVKEEAPNEKPEPAAPEGSEDTP